MITETEYQVIQSMSWRRDREIGQVHNHFLQIKFILKSLAFDQMRSNNSIRELLDEGNDNIALEEADSEVSSDSSELVSGQHF